MDRNDTLKLENQLCFPLYAASREVIKKYRPALERLGLTYTQYVVMMVLWEETSISVRELGKRLFLDSGTLTPLLKTLAGKNLLSRRRDSRDERVVIVSLTDEGSALKEAAYDVPEQAARCVDLEPEEAAELYRLLYKLLDHIE